MPPAQVDHPLSLGGLAQARLHGLILIRRVGYFDLKFVEFRAIKFTSAENDFVLAKSHTIHVFSIFFGLGLGPAPQELVGP